MQLDGGDIGDEHEKEVTPHSVCLLESMQNKKGVSWVGVEGKTYFKILQQMGGNGHDNDGERKDDAGGVPEGLGTDE